MIAVRAWALTAAGCAAVVCLVGWPHPTLCVTGLITAVVALLVGLRLLAAERGQTGRPPCAGCAGCGGPDCAERPDGSGPDPETARTDPDAPEVQPVDLPGHDPDGLRTRLATAIRHAAHNCDSKCGLTEDGCAAAHPIQIEYWTDDAVSGVAGPIDALTDVALTAIRPERCCSCGSNDVVYHNFREQPFCSPCADGDRPAIHRAAEQQIRDAAGRLLYPVGARVLDALDEQHADQPSEEQHHA